MQAFEGDFAFEESGGFMSEVVNGLPNLASNVMHLKEDHRTILDQSEELCRIAREEALTPEGDGSRSERIC